MIKVSIVVPVYNREKNLSRCIESIIRQSLKEFECILVDDGSTDNSGAICDSFALKDSRIKVIHQKNKGVSAARNIGISIAIGEYVGFVDSDDWIDENMYSFLYNNAIEKKADISICGCYPFNCGKNKRFLPSLDAIHSMLASNYLLGGFSFTRLINKKLLESVKFNENIKCYEDIAFFYQLFQLAKTIYWNDVPCYHFDGGGDSLTSSYLLNKNKIEGIKAIERIKNNEKNLFLKKELDSFIYRWHLDAAINYVSHRNVNCDSFLICKRKLIRKKYSRDCTLRQKCWRLIIISDSLKEIYWFLKRVKPN